jgi:hypothetical protein
MIFKLYWKRSVPVSVSKLSLLVNLQNVSWNTPPPLHSSF